jgi:hypothetical protein
MMRFTNIALSVVVAVAAALVMSCSNENDTVLQSQQTAISQYLTSSHQPRLIPEAEVASSFDPEPQYYSQWGLDIYRYISTMYAEGREEREILDFGDECEIVYTAYLFSRNKPSTRDIFATNDPESINALVELGLNTEYEWSDEPFSLRLGDGSLLGSLETALEGCREGDNVEIYLTYDKAYGKHTFGMLPSKSSVVWYIDIVSINK